MSVIGTSYFGAKIANKTEKEISENTTKTSEALEHTEELKFDIIEAKKETEQANLRTEELRLKVAEAQASAEIAKLERDKLLQQQKYIKSISISAELSIPPSDECKSGIGSTIYTPTGNEKNTNAILFHNYFSLTSYTIKKELGCDIIMSLDFSKPNHESKIYGNSLDLFKEGKGIGFTMLPLLKKYKDIINHNSDITIKINIIVNGIKAFSAVTTDTYKGILQYHLTVYENTDAFKEIPMVVLGDKELIKY